MPHSAIWNCCAKPLLEKPLKGFLSHVRHLDVNTYLNRMEVKYLSHPLSLLMKYGVFIFFTIISILGGLILILKNSEVLGGLAFVAFGILIFTIIRNLKEVSFSAKQLIVRDINRRELVELQNVKRLSRINIGTFYRVEYSVDNKLKSADIWPKHNLFQAINGKLPGNFQEFLNLVNNRCQQNL